MNAKETKQTLRQKLIRLRKEISQLQRQEANTIIYNTVVTRPEYIRATCICVFLSLPEEVDTRSLLEHSLTLPTSVVVPRVEGEELHLYKIGSSDDLITGSFGIDEPKPMCPEVDPASIDLFIVPGVAFDREGYRLGWGKGYYDKLLDGLSALKIGLAYGCQIVSGLPREKYDIPMDVIITENETIVPPKEV